MINEVDYVDLGLACAEVCRVLDRGMRGRRVDELGQAVFEAIEQLNMQVESAVDMSGDALTGLSIRAVAEIQRSVIERGKRNVVSRHFHAKNDKEMIATWRLDLNRILHVFNVRSAAFCLTAANWPALD